MTEKPWYHESSSGSLLNEWSITHFLWGLFAAKIFPGTTAIPLILHTAYEYSEQYLFPSENRDTSMVNHIGDSLSFYAGLLIGKK